MNARALVLGVLAALLPLQARGQERLCGFTNLGTTTRDDQTGIVTLHTEFEVTCSDGVVLRARSGTLSELSRELVLVGSVYFEDAQRTLTSDHATYTSVIGRLYATGNVVFVDRAEGTTLRGPELEYFRAMEGRPQAQVNAGQRPHLTLMPRARADGARPEKDEPLEIDADRMVILGRDDLTATGDVVIMRPDLRAVAGEARYQGASEALELRQSARIETEEYTLVGEVINARMAEGDLEHVRSRGSARMAGEDLVVTAPELQLFFEEDLLIRTLAVVGEQGDSTVKAVAASKSFQLSADSLDASMPAQRLERVVAVGGACGESIDSTAVEAVRMCAGPGSSAGERPATELVAADWMLGDTITGFFAADTAARAEAADTAAADTAVVLTRLVARGNAQSLYRAEAQEPGSGRALSFLSAEEIDLSFEGGEVQGADVTGMRRGLYLEPVAVSAAPPPAAADPDDSGPPPGAPPPVPEGGPQ